MGRSARDKGLDEYKTMYYDISIILKAIFQLKEPQ